MNHAHTLAYSLVGLQEMNLAYRFPLIYWNCACLIADSGIDSATTAYDKIAIALGKIKQQQVNVSLVDINKSGLNFTPDAENNRIITGLKSISNVGDDLAKTIIENRPYVSLIDFYSRIKPNKQAMIMLIKSGAFDQFNSRYHNMVEFIWCTCDKKKRLTLQNMSGLIKHNLLPETTEEEIMARRIYEFNRYLKTICKVDSEKYKIDERSRNFLIEIGQDDLIEGNILLAKTWDKKVYQGWMDVFRKWIATNKEVILDKLNTSIFMEDWNKYGKGSLATWEMDSVCFYHSDHELKNVNRVKYGLTSFDKISEIPVVEKVFKKGDREIPIFRLYRICGTCIAKDKNKNICYLLTDSGVVPVKFPKAYFSIYDRQLFEKNPDGTKTIIEKSWFNKSNFLFVQGVRQGDEFIPKKYKNSGLEHQLYHIDSIDEQGNLELRHERKGEVDEDEV